MTVEPRAQRKLDWWNIGLWAAQVALRILPRLTPLAALGFAIIQVLALGVHAWLGDLAESIPLNLALLGLSLLVIWGRTRKAVVQPRF